MLRKIEAKIELLAPGGDLDSIKAAILAGADAVYCGLDRFNARNRAKNLSIGDLPGVVRLAHKHNCKLYLTLNILITESEIRAFFALLKRVIPSNIDGVILQDLGMFYLLSEYFPDLPIHASTQLSTHNTGQIQFLQAFNTSRVNLSRELNLEEIETLTTFGKPINISTEVFVHGSQCISFSGICYLSSVLSGNSGNRGRCSQPCRDQYISTPEGKNYPLNLKDNSAFLDLPELVNAGVASLKIEGRIKKFDYIYTVVKAWKEQMLRFYDHQTISRDKSELYKVFNRDFSNSYLHGQIGQDMFIDHPRDHSLAHHIENKGQGAGQGDDAEVLKFYQEKEDERSKIREMIQALSAEKVPLILKLKGQAGALLSLSVETNGRSFVLTSGINLSLSGTRALSKKLIMSKFRALEETAYFIQELDLSGLHGELYLPLGELTILKRELIAKLNGSGRGVPALNVPLPPRNIREEKAAVLSVLVDKQDHLESLRNMDVDLYFQLPSSFRQDFAEIKALLLNNQELIPYFPSVLIGDEYLAARDLLEQLAPSRLVTNNTGIAFEAFRLGIPWIAGPSLNLVNSFSLLGLKRKFNCSGAFISSELSKNQMNSIRRPGDFALYYSIYHPMVLITSRQCLFQQVTGCDKVKIDVTCISSCEKRASLTHIKGEELYLEKTRGNHHTLYHKKSFLNTDILEDLPAMFTGFFIDLREVGGQSTSAREKKKIIQGFKDLCGGDKEAEQEFNQILPPSTKMPYLKGI